MVDDDLLLLNVYEAVLPCWVSVQAVLDHGDLSGRHELGHDLAEKDLGIGVLVDLKPVRD
jgi:hypothetical protein